LGKARVKRYVQEIGSARVHGLFDRRERIACVSLGYVEAVAALSRRLPEEDLARVEPRLKLDWENMTRLQVTDEVIDRAVVLARSYKLRGADAVHLAAAIGLHRAMAGINESLVLVASDDELLGAARTAGLQFEDPVSGRTL
jgi:predicted nucleic acid-binding protein